MFNIPRLHRMLEHKTFLTLSATRRDKKHLKQSQQRRQPHLKCLEDSEEPRKRWHCSTSMTLSRHTGLNIAWYTRHLRAKTPQPCINQHLWMSIVCVPCDTQFATRKGKLSSRSVGSCYKSAQSNQCKKKIGGNKIWWECVESALSQKNVWEVVM